MSGDLFEFHDGLHLRDSVLWFDAPAARPLCFISHANVPGASRHQKILATKKTVELLRSIGTSAHGRGRRVHEPQALVSPYGQRFSLGQLSLELFPSGHVLGGASLWVQFRKTTIVYSGYINPRKSQLLAERLEARSCDVLVLSCPFARRRHVFPPVEQVAEALVRFVVQSLEREATPVIFCSPLGEAQVVAQLLHRAGIRCRGHRQVFAACRVYRKAGLDVGEVRQFPVPKTAREAVIWPAALHASPALRRLPSVRTALVSGLALEDEVKRQMACDAYFALSCHGDYPSHLEYVRACEPREVVLTQGSSRELKEDLEALGLKVHTCGAPQQMTLF
jgi:putative mRNA 3-end processing factor